MLHMDAYSIIDLNATQFDRDGVDPQTLRCPMGHFLFEVCGRDRLKPKPFVPKDTQIY